MGSSEIWDKYHKCCIGNGDKFHKVKFTIFNTTRVVFIPNFTAITKQQNYLNTNELQTTLHCSICTSNSMGSSEIWDKYHSCCIGNGDKFHEHLYLGNYVAIHCYGSVTITNHFKAQIS